MRPPSRYSPTPPRVCSHGTATSCRWTFIAAGAAIKVAVVATRLIATAVRTSNMARRAVTVTRAAVQKLRPAQSCRVNSFIPGTLVLMADGTTKPIEDIQLEDLVLATDPDTGTTVAQPVTDLIIADGVKDLVRVGTATDGDGVIEWVTATAGHPFYVPARGWTDAGDLELGDLLVGDNGTLIEITRLDTDTRLAVVHNLTVAVIHTYYVLTGDDAGGETALVHNCGSINQWNQAIQRVKAPSSIKRVDRDVQAHGGSVHVHFRDGRALRQDGIWKHGNSRPLTNKEVRWLRPRGWNILR